jgi:DNA polymerase I
VKESVDEIIAPIAEPASAKLGEPHPTTAAQAPKPAPGAAPHHVFLIDGSGFIFRAYFARARDPKAERFQRKSDGMPTEVVMIFSNMLDKYRRETDADHMAVIFDASGTSFRNRIYDAYKANRREMPEDLLPQLEHVRRAAAAFDICQIELRDFEADDLIATYARHAVEAGAKVTILSSDKDLMQLVSDDVRMRDPMTDRPIAEAEVREKFGVGPDKVIEVQALCGDSTDNVPGVPGIGVKTAAELINTYGDLETLLAHAHEIKQPKRREALIENEAKARLSKELVKLDDNVPLPCPLSALKVKPYSPEKLFPFLDEMELRALKGRIVQRLSIAPEVVPVEQPEPVLPELPPFTAPRTYALVDTVEGLDHWIEAAEQSGVVAIWPETSNVAGTRPALAGIALALAPGLAAYVPVGHRMPEAEAPSLPLGHALTHPALRAGSPLSRTAGEGAERSEAGEGDAAAPWEEWEIPREAGSDWPTEAQKLHTEWWAGRIARQKERRLDRRQGRVRIPLRQALPRQIRASASLARSRSRACRRTALFPVTPTTP